MNLTCHPYYAMLAVFLCLVNIQRACQPFFLEAAAQKCAIVVSNCAGASDIIPESNFGTVLQDCAIDSIQKALLVYFENPDLLIEHSHNVHDLVCSRFTWSQTALSLCTNVLDTLSTNNN